jgi:enoyl-CoA hydratase
VAEPRWAFVRADLDGVLGVLRLCRPERMNTLSPPLIEEFAAATRHLADSGAKVIVVTGDERAFCAGADLDAVSRTTDVADFLTWVARIQAVFAEFETLGVVTVAAIDGYCLGGGLELAMRCDFRLATARARLGLPEIRHGLLPTGGGLSILVEIVGLPVAKDLVLTGRTLTATEAVDLGLVTAIVDPPVLDAARAWADRFRGHPRLAIRTAKSALRLARTGTPAGWTDAVESLTASVLISGREAQAGIAAFLDKREATFG